MLIRRLFLVLMAALAVTGCSGPQTLSIPLEAPDYWPTVEWRSANPESQGMDSAALAGVLQQVNDAGAGVHSVLVVRNGYLVTEAYVHPYTRDTRVHIQSVTKSVIGMLVGIAIREGLIEGSDQLLEDFIPGRSAVESAGRYDPIALRHLLSMTSGLDCAEFSGDAAVMEDSENWVRFMLDLPQIYAPGKKFGYCNGNAHLLSAVISKAAGMSAREYANLSLFAPLGIPSVAEVGWGSDPQGNSIGGFGLHLRPVDLAKLAFLFLHNGSWDGEQIIPAGYVVESTTQQISKGDGSGYGFLWTVYPEDGHYAALGLGGQQVHVFPAENLVVVVTAALESFAEAPEIEALLTGIRGAVRSDMPLAENSAGYAALQAEIEHAANPVLPVASLSATAQEISNQDYRFDENPMGWETVCFVFEEGLAEAQILLNNVPVVVGLDNLYRVSNSLPGGKLLLRGRWIEENVFVLDYPYPFTSQTVLGELGETEFRFEFTGRQVEVTIQQLVFGGEPIVAVGAR